MEIELCDEFYYRVNSNNFDYLKNFNTTEQELIRNNPKIPLYIGEFIKIRKNKYLTHIVKPMETIEAVSKIYGLDKDKIKQDNDLNNDKLFIGQRLKIYK